MVLINMNKINAIVLMSAIWLCGLSSIAAENSHPKASTCQSRSAKPLSDPKQFVQSFYNWYIISKDHEPDVRGTEAVLKQRKELLDATLYMQLQNDEAAAAKSPGEIVGLDFDPFVASNGLVYDKYETGTVVAKGTTFRVPVYGIESGKKTAKPVLEAEVITKNGKCLFSNFHYGKSDFPENENLLSVLKTLRKDREKYSKN